MFEIEACNAENYRKQTRRITLVIAAIFVVLALLLSSLAVTLFGAAGGDNFRWNLAGVLLALVLTIALVRFKLWSLPWMAPAVYGWRLKRSLMRVTNVMHHVKAGVAAGDPTAMKLLRFYHLGVTQMYQLDGNSSDLSQMLREIDQHQASMQAQGLEVSQPRLDPAWLAAVKQADN
ncbi:DUF3087 family protein [Pseudomonas sp. UBA2684]|uniref:DUF3087 family protein n=1 Tax=Pseudomonas sp. UBA2684 TaxID=1947311 RepID=UPI000E906CF4|nr:DUF3087 family protein [Pseudomonas sp. UBA2684]HBX57582.1 DUF3087 domain-containing protein [Pseudomonas sp.]|tara:strand:- start:20835 stop:21362 length:528 start_codon:yes stop_codon:yes gene_type:complete